jgi:hypothetical protein
LLVPQFGFVTPIGFPESGRRHDSGYNELRADS